MGAAGACGRACGGRGAAPYCSSGRSARGGFEGSALASSPQVPGAVDDTRRLQQDVSPLLVVELERDSDAKGSLPLLALKPINSFTQGVP